ncbi:hypothetical protein BLA29_015247, partial [Euroglyphus maynei]
MGQVDDDEQVLDEKLWDNDDGEDDLEDNNQKGSKENDEQNDQMTGGKEDFDTNKVANSDNDQLTSQKNEEKFEDN